MQLRNGSGALYHNNEGTDPAPDRAVTTTAQRGGPAQYPVQALVTTTPVTPPIKGNNIQHILRKEATGIHTKNSPSNKILNPHRLNRNAPT